jgi:diaminohydroxyphosphoribosylaminopyrimidine deaminase/5-amino-6-(5-phosphoribosylamino)uracil reductase
MKHAIELAKKGSGRVSPNPLVGAVIVKDNKIVGEGWHHKCGEAHAEVNAFKSAEEAGIDVSGADMYVTLEPCSHFGKTPPCANAIVAHGIKRVFVGSSDNNPKVSGKGIKILRDNGIEVIENVLYDECRELNQVFFKYISTQLPYVVLKSAMSLDGKIATSTGSSQWITSEKAREYGHYLRHELKAIMVGVNTVLSDNPALTCRIPNGINPIKIIVDSKLRTPINARAVSDNCIILTTDKCDKTKKTSFEKNGVMVIEVDESDGEVNLNNAMKLLGQRGIDSILLEGGGTLNFSALKQGIVDKYMAFIAPKLIGGRDALTPVEGNGIADVNDALNLEKVSVRQIDKDYLISGYLRWW